MRRPALIAGMLLALVPSVTGARAPARAHEVRIPAPAQFDFTLAWLRLRGPVSGLRVTTSGPVGLDYVAAAAGRKAPRRVLVLVVNRRPRGSLAPDLKSVTVRVSTHPAERAPAVTARVDILAHGARRADCSLLPPKRPAVGSDLRALLGGAFGPFTAREAVAAGLDEACGVPTDRQFERLVRQEPALPPPHAGP